MIKSILLLFFAGCFIGLQAQTEIEKVKETLTKGEIEGHIYFLSDDLLLGRQTGEPGNKIAASYLANMLRSYGVKPNPQTASYYQPFELKKTNPSVVRTLQLDSRDIEQPITLNAVDLNVSAEAVYLNFGEAADYKGKNVMGKIVIVRAGSPDAQQARQAFGMWKDKMELAKKAGALGVIEIMKVNQSMWERIAHYFESSRLEVPEKDPDTTNENDPFYLWVADADESLANRLSEKKRFPASIELQKGTNEMVKTQNVIGVVEGTDPELKNEYVIYSAHYDHVGVGTPDKKGDSIYNGARDNAVGTVTVLAMAENLAKYPTKRSALFILFTGEEKGLLGSEYYVENPVIPLAQMVYCFNSDNGGYNNTSLATIIGLERTTAAQEIKEGVAAFGLKAIDDPAPEQGLFDRSDNVHFAAKGIPAPTFSMGFDAFDDEINKYYHQPGDHAESMDFDYLHKFFGAYVFTGRKIGNMEKTPFWVTGDKYEQAGKKLYNRNLKLD